MKEVGEDYPSVKGFNIVSEHFSIGKALPVTIAIKNNEKMDNQYILTELDDITEAIKSVKGVDKVYSVTQPKGERIEELYINDQTAVVKDGLKEATGGVDKINSGLGDAITKIQSKSADTESIDKLQKGAQDLTSSINLINQSVTKLRNGLNSGAQASKDLENGIGNIIMLTGILIVLFIVTRDFWMSIFIMLSLVASYYISISASGLVFNHILDKGNLTWNVPFFSFIMIIALGVYYSIFLVMRHRENEHLSLTESIVSAAKSVGGVIFSAGIILSGTFAAMYPSGVLTLMQLSITVILGILFLCLVFLPVFIPAMISIKAKVIKRFGANEN